MKEGKLQEIYQINVRQMYKLKLPKIHVTLFFSVFSKLKV